MAIDFGPMPDFSVKQPPPFDPLAFQQKQATLAGLLDENKLRQQLAPLNVQEAQGRVQALDIENKLKTMQLQGQQALTKWLQEGDTNETPADFSLRNKVATYIGVDPKDPILDVVGSMAKHGVPGPMLAAEAQQMLQRRTEYNKGTEEAQKIIKDNYDVWKDATAQMFKASPEERSIVVSQMLPRLQAATHLSPELDSMVQLLRQNPEMGVPIAYNLVAAQDKTLGLSKTAAEAEKAKNEAANLAAKTDPNSPLYDPSTAYLAKRAAAGDPEAKSILAQQTKQAGAKAGAEAAARQPYELALKQEEVGQNPAFAFNPQTGQRELTTIGEAKQKGQQFAKVTQADIEKETSLNSQMNDMQLNTSRYRAALNAMGPLSTADRNAMTRILSDASLNGFLTNGATLGAMMDQISQGEKGKAWNSLSADKQDALIGFLRMKNTGLLAQKVLTGMGRASKEALDIELSNMPSPIEGATVGNKKLDAWQDNLDQINSRSVKLPWMETPKDVRTRVEGQATQQYNQMQAGKPKGQYRGTPSQDTGKRAYEPGMTVLINGRPRTVSKVYPDGTWDVR